MPSKKAFGSGAVVLVFNVSPGNFCRTARASGNLRCHRSTPACAQVITPFGSMSLGIAENCLSAVLRSPFHAAATYHLHTTDSNELGAAAIARSTVLSAASKLRKAI